MWGTEGKVKFAEIFLQSVFACVGWKGRRVGMIGSRPEN